MASIPPPSWIAVASRVPRAGSPLLLTGPHAPSWGVWLIAAEWIIIGLGAAGALACAGFMLAARRAGDAGQAERWKERAVSCLAVVLFFFTAQVVAGFRWHVT